MSQKTKATKKVSRKSKTTTSLDQAFADVNQELLKLFIKKHQDYGKGNILAIKELGIALRITEKVERLKNLLATGKQPANESIKETWKDIAVYSIIAVLYNQGQFQKLEVDPKSPHFVSTSSS